MKKYIILLAFLAIPSLASAGAPKSADAVYFHVGTLVMARYQPGAQATGRPHGNPRRLRAWLVERPDRIGLLVRLCYV